MEIRNLEIEEFPAIVVRDALRAFIDLDPSYTFRDGEFCYKPKRLSAKFLAKELNVSNERAQVLLNALIEQKYIDKQRLTPTTKGMALSSAEDRERLTLSEADSIFAEFIDRLEKVNLRPNARVFVERAYVFGSYYRKEETVGDIDLLLEVSLPDDCLPEDLEEREKVVEQLKISEYLSFHHEFDPIAGNADKDSIYERNRGKT